MIPTVDNYVEWFTSSVRYYFMHEGLGFLSFSLDQIAEEGFPASPLLAQGNRAAGLVFLRPAPSAGVTRAFTQTAEDRARMAAPGLVYALPQTAEMLDQQLLHQKTFFAEPDSVEFDAANSSVTARSAVGFKELATGLAAGTAGRELPAGVSAQAFLAEASDAPASLWLVVNPSAKLVYALKA